MECPLSAPTWPPPFFKEKPGKESGSHTAHKTPSKKWEQFPKPQKHPPVEASSHLWTLNEIRMNSALMYFSQDCSTLKKWLAVLYIWWNLRVLKMLTKLADKKNLPIVFPILEDTDNLNKNLDNGFTRGVVLHMYLVLAYTR